MKKRFLAVHDYGLGGIWMYVDSPDAATIEQRYRELKVFETVPAFFSDEDLVRIERELHFDIDAPPSGYLAELVARRDAAA
jgi:hypothetical protein